jgi:hypothetical protein
MSDPWSILGWLLVILLGVPAAIVVVCLVVTAVFVVFSFVAAMVIGMLERLRVHRRRLKQQLDEE